MDCVWGADGQQSMPTTLPRGSLPGSAHSGRLESSDAQCARTRARPRACVHWRAQGLTLDVLLVRWIGRPTHTCTGSVSSVSQADPEQFSKSALYPDASHDYYGVGHHDASMSASRPEAWPSVRLSSSVKNMRFVYYSDGQTINSPMVTIRRANCQHGLNRRGVRRDVDHSHEGAVPVSTGRIQPSRAWRPRRPCP